jgi:predicted enzyme related to lactoylglutathione lyase
MRPPLNGGTLGGRRRAKVSMTVSQSAHVLAVPDLKRSGDFYSRVLAFEIHEIGDPGWRLFVNGQCRIMAGECPDALPAEKLGDHSYFAYLTVDDVSAYHQRAKHADAEFVKSLRDEPWGTREFGLRTVDGHRIMIGQRMP